MTRAFHPHLPVRLYIYKIPGWERKHIGVALGSTAAQVLMGRTFRVLASRGKIVESDWAGPVMATVHPSSVLRTPDEDRERARREFFRDIRRVAKELARLR